MSSGETGTPGSVSGRASICGAARSRTRTPNPAAASGRSVRMTAGAASRTEWASRCADTPGSSGTYAAPVLSTPSIAATQPGDRGTCNPTNCPTPTPWSSSQCAIRFARAFSRPYDQSPGAGAGQRDGPRVAAHLRLEQRRNAHRALCPGGRRGADRGLRGGGEVGQQVDPLGAQARDSGRVEEPCVEFDPAPQRRAGVLDHPGQLELGDLVGVDVPGAGRRTEADLAVAAGMQVEHHLEQWTDIRPTVIQDCVDDAVQRHVLMGVGVEADVADVLDQGAESGVRAHPHPQRDDVDEVADQVVQFAPPPGIDRGPDNEVLRPGAPVDQRAEGGEQHGERRGFAAAGQGAHAPGRLLRKLEPKALPARGVGAGRAGPVGGKRGDRGSAVQPLAPEVHLLLVRQRLLPGGVVGVLDRRRGQVRVLSGECGFVESGEFAFEDGERGLVPDDVVEHRDDRVRRVGAADEPDPEQRTGAQAERRARVLLDRRRGGRLALVLGQRAQVGPA